VVEVLRRLVLGTDPRYRPDVMLDERRHAAEQGGPVARRLENLAVVEHHRKAVATLRTMPMIRPITAMTLRVEPREPKRFDDGGKVARMLGWPRGPCGAARRAARIGC
jgi:hypothetical protein